eukprot:453707-Pleurochrysis_carterae.AAC.2
MGSSSKVVAAPTVMAVERAAAAVLQSGHAAHSVPSSRPQVVRVTPPPQKKGRHAASQNGNPLVATHHARPLSTGHETQEEHWTSNATTGAWTGTGNGTG